MAAGLCYGSRGGGAQVAFHHQVGAYDTDSLIGALEGLRRFLGGQKATPVMGRAAHPPQQADAHLAAPTAVLAGGGTATRLRPDLNPVEGLWSSLKGVELANWPASASSGSGPPRTCRFRSCATAACPYGENRSLEPANLFFREDHEGPPSLWICLSHHWDSRSRVLQERINDSTSATGPRCASLSGLRIELMLVI
jgi:hypothetical protein